MQTLAEIEQAEHVAREKAWRYGRLLDEQARLTKTIARLSVASANTDDRAVLLKLNTLVAQVNPLLSTRGLAFLPGGFLVRDLLTAVVANALAQVATIATTASAELADARTKLVSVEDALEEFKE